MRFLPHHVNNNSYGKNYSHSVIFIHKKKIQNKSTKREKYENTARISFLFC